MLWRRWPAGRGSVAFIGLNPSSADEHLDDPTIRRCVAFARSWGYRQLLVGNLFALCATRPGHLRLSANPDGAGNAGWLERLAGLADLVIACWGTHGTWRGRDRQFAAGRTDLHCLSVNRDGSPGHPLYLRGDSAPRPWCYRPQCRGAAALTPAGPAA